MKRNILSATAVRHAKPGRLSDGGNLYLWTKENGNQYWIFRFRNRRTHKPNEMSLGPVVDVTLSEAREKARILRNDLREGIDPVERKKAAKQALLMDQASTVTFRSCVDQYIAAKRPGWKNAKHAQEVENTLNTYAAKLMPLPVQSIDTNLVMQCLEPIWVTKTVTATRVRQRIEAVISWATARKYRKGENPARWRDHLENLLAAPKKIQKVKHRPALDYRDIGDFMIRLRGLTTVAASCLELQILTAVRPGEVTKAHSDEFDLKERTWTLPGERTKNGEELVIPLSDRAIEIVKDAGDGFLFISFQTKRPLTTEAGMQTVRNLQPGITAHGFRATFRTWAADRTAYPREVCEQALNHTIGNVVELTYNRSDLLAKRRRLMNDWATYCDQPSTTSEVTPIRGKSAA